MQGSNESKPGIPQSSGGFFWQHYERTDKTYTALSERLFQLEALLSRVVTEANNDAPRKDYPDFVEEVEAKAVSQELVDRFSESEQRLASICQRIEAISKLLNALFQEP